jgi:basic membrane protein A
MLFNRTIPRDDHDREVFDNQVISNSFTRSFIERFQERADVVFDNPEQIVVMAYTYDATNILLQSIRQVAGVDEEGNLIIGRQALSRAVRNTNKFAGVSGEISFDENGDRIMSNEGAICQPGDRQIGLFIDMSSPSSIGYYEGARIGLIRTSDELPICPHIVEIHDDSEYEPLLSQLAREDMDHIFVAANAADAIASVANQYPNVTFTILDLTIDPPLNNVQMIQFQVDQASFQAGYLAAAWAEIQDPTDPKIGFVGGMPIPSVEQFIVGYQSGVDYYNQTNSANVKVDGGFIGNFDRRVDASNMANELVDLGADVIINVAGQAGEGALLAVRERGKWGIGVDVDQFYTIPEVQDILLTSVVKRMDNSVFSSIDTYLQDEFRGGEIVQLDLQSGSVDLAPFHNFEDQIPDTVKDALQEIRQGIINGDIDTGW